MFDSFLFAISFFKMRYIAGRFIPTATCMPAPCIPITSEHCPAWWSCSETDVDEALPQNSSLRKPGLFSEAFFANRSSTTLLLIGARSVYHVLFCVVSGGF